MKTDSALYRQLGLTDEEYEAIARRLGRDPSYTELAMFSVMWSEHCSYKSSRIHLAALPTSGERVLVGPGEGAGIVEVTPGTAVAWKIESHNHPSFVEPFSGAATGVGGIVRDILSMGARPIALLDSLRFGSLADARSRYVAEGVVAGISAYGNAIGVPTVGGEAVFDDSYKGNPLVNVACLGVVERSLMRARADGVGNAVILIGSTTGRDGIGGASVLASAEFDEDSGAKRPSVQVGDPFTEKLLIEASLELVGAGLVAGLQDLGAGGIACPTSEMSAKAGTGMRIDVDRVHRREPGMEAFEVMISESQERMLAVVEPAKVDDVVAVCAKWGLDASVIGEVTPLDRVSVISDGEVVADAPAAALADGPSYDRPHSPPEWVHDLRDRPCGDDAPRDVAEAFLSVLTSPSIASKRWVWEQYDHMIFLGTVQGPGSDAAVIRLPRSEVAVALTVDGPGRYCALDPYEGARLAVAEAARNVACTGARPVAVTNCLNFGNPEKPEVMWQLVEVVRGMKDACTAFETPVTGGNVSFYNETDGRAIYPTPVIGMLGVLDTADASIPMTFREPGDVVVLLGTTRPGDFGGSEFAQVVNQAVGGWPPQVDLEGERQLHALLSHAAAGGFLRSAHDLSDGGLAIALAESAIAGNVGFAVEITHDGAHRELFSESPGRVIVSCLSENVKALVDLARRTAVPARVIGHVGGSRLDFGAFSFELDEVVKQYEDVLPSSLSATMG